MDSAERRVQNGECRTESAERRVQNGECRIGVAAKARSLSHFHISSPPKLIPTIPCNCLNYCRLSATCFRVACVRPLLFCSNPMLSSFAYPAPLFPSVLSTLRSDAVGEGPGLRRNSPGTLSLRLLRSAVSRLRTPCSAYSAPRLVVCAHRAPLTSLRG